MDKQATTQIGNQAEQRCQRFLESQGLVIIAKNYRGKKGEIDLIARDSDCTVFVEVRYRSNRNYGQPFETVNRQKQARLVATAWQYLQQHKQAARGPCRFDIVSMSREQQGDQVDWIKNAFDINY